MARATDKNKAEFMTLLQNMETKGVANFTGVLLKSYETLAKFQNKTQGVFASASRAVMVLTDGIIGDYEKVFDVAEEKFDKDGVVKVWLFEDFLAFEFKPFRNELTFKNYIFFLRRDFYDKINEPYNSLREFLHILLAKI